MGHGHRHEINDSEGKFKEMHNNSVFMLKHIFSSLDINILLSSFGNLFSLIVLTMGLFSPFPVLLLTDPFSLALLFAFSMKANLGVRESMLWNHSSFVNAVFAVFRAATAFGPLSV